MDEPQPASQRRKLLIVDDEEDITMSLHSVATLFVDNLDVVTANSGEEALRHLGTDRFDLIISDYRMPNMDGVSFLSRAKAIQPAAARVLLTAFSQVDLEQEARKTADLHAYLRKPVQRAELVATIENLLRVPHPAA